jgi:hypothetical protein
MSLLAIDEEQYAIETVYAPGTYAYAKDRVPTRHVLGVRTFINPNDPNDVEKAHAAQDAIRVEQPNGPGTVEFPNWDAVSQMAVREDWSSAPRPFRTRKECSARGARSTPSVT